MYQITALCQNFALTVNSNTIKINGTNVPPSSPEPLNLHGHDGHHFPGGPPRSFGALSHHAEMAGETWG
jgi:hypothetical protein